MRGIQQLILGGALAASSSRATDKTRFFLNRKLREKSPNPLTVLGTEKKR
jgi:hypothetical protein